MDPILAPKERNQSLQEGVAINEETESSEKQLLAMLEYIRDNLREVAALKERVDGWSREIHDIMQLLSPGETIH